MKAQWLFLICIFYCHIIFAGVSPYIHWMKLSTPHFDVLYNSEQQNLAQTYAIALENNYQQLENVFAQKPVKTVVILNDNTDATNGYATPIPYPTIMIFPVLPGPLSGIGEYGYWPQDITVHEYTHILSFSQIRGFFKVFQNVFGQILIPNAFLPRWYLEGVAVYNETALTQKGRLRSNYQSATLRAMTEENSLMRYQFPEINESDLDTWPYGMRPYLFGSLMWEEMIEQNNPELISRLHTRYGGRVPFLLTAPIQEEVNLNYEQLFQNKLNKIQNEFTQQIQSLKSQPLTNKKFLITKESSFAPAYSENGEWLALLKTAPGDDPQVQLYQNGKLKKYKRLPAGSIQSLSWLPDNSGFLYEKMNYVNPYDQFYDIYYYKLSKQKSERLTYGLRGRQPVMTPDSQNIIFIQQEAGLTRLAQIDKDGKNIKTLYQPPAQYRLSKPQMLNGDEVVFLERDTQGNDRILKFNRGTQVVTSLYQSQDSVIDLSYSKKLGLIMVEANNGVYNAYLLEGTQKKALTHASTGVFQIHLNEQNKTLAATYMTSSGLKVAEILPSDWSQTPQNLPKVKKEFKSDLKPSPLSENATQYPVEEYSAWPYLKPYYWLPTVYSTSEDTTVQVQTAGVDALAQHQYSLFVSHEVEAKKTEYLLSYLNQTSPVSLGLTYSTAYNHYLNFAEQKKLTQATLSGMYTLPWKLPNMEAGLMIEKTDEEWYSYKFRHFGLIGLFKYSDISKTVADISAESGWGLQAQVKNYNNDMSDILYNSASLTGSHFMAVPKLNHHAVSLRWLMNYTDKEMSLARSPFISTNVLLAPNMVHDQWIMRGYLSSQFVAYRLANVNLEYRFPVADLMKGWGTFPLFLKKAHISLVSDASQIQGYVYDPNLETYFRSENNKVYSDYGLEFKTDISLAYQLPATLYFGAYWPTEKKEGYENQFVIGFQL